MSRTIRRRNTYGRRARHQYIDEGLTVINGILHSYWPRHAEYYEVWPRTMKYLSPEQYVLRRKAWYHGDNKAGTWNASAWFRRQLEAEYRANQNNRLRKAIVDGTEESLIVDKRVNNANWEWW